MKKGVANVKLAFTIVRGRGGSAEAQPSHCGAFPGVTTLSSPPATRLGRFWCVEP